jgi:hypothetical protein
VYSPSRLDSSNQTSGSHLPVTVKTGLTRHVITENQEIDIA